jgi:hypothetical protein
LHRGGLSFPFAYRQVNEILSAEEVEVKRIFACGLILALFLVAGCKKQEEPNKNEAGPTPAAQQKNVIPGGKDPRRRRSRCKFIKKTRSSHQSPRISRRI